MMPFIDSWLFPLLYGMVLPMVIVCRQGGGFYFKIRHSP